MATKSPTKENMSLTARFARVKHIAVKHWVDHSTYRNTKRDSESDLGSCQRNHDNSDINLTTHQLPTLDDTLMAEPEQPGSRHTPHEPPY